MPEDRVVASMGHGNTIPPPKISVLPPICPDHGRSLHLAMGQLPFKIIIMPVYLTTVTSHITQSS